MSNANNKNKVGGAGVLVLVHKTVVPICKLLIQYLNRNGRVSNEVLSLHLVEPTLEGVMNLTESLKSDPAFRHVENVDNFRPNNGVRDLLSGSRLNRDQIQNHMLLVSVETVTDEYRKKYPNPNITLQAGSIETKESIMSAGIRELHEEAKILVQPNIVNSVPLRLLGGGLFMYVCYIHQRTEVKIIDGSIHLTGNDKLTWPRGVKIPRWS
jgi:hypothetical protein